MQTIQKLAARLRALFGKRKLDAEMDEEMRSHVELRTQANIAAGMKPDEARLAALKQFGWTESIKETCRERRGISWIEDIMRDTRFGVRQLRKNPGFTSVAVLTLALGIGANTAIFSVVNGVLLKPLPYPDPDRLVRVYESIPEKGKAKIPVAGPTFRDWRAQNKVFEELAAQQPTLLNLTGRGEPRRLQGERVSANLLALLGVKPFMGRSFTTEEDTYGNYHAVLLSYSLWQREFGGDANVVGEFVTLEGTPHEIVGVLPPGLSYPNAATELWVPIAFSPDDTSRGNRVLQVVGRIRKGVTFSEANTEMNTIAARLSLQYPETKGARVTLAGLQGELIGDSRAGLLMLLGAVGLVMLIACANVGNLLLARASLRSKEFALRAALGARRMQIARQLLTESLLLTGAGGVLGVLLAGWILSSITSLRVVDLPLLNQVRLDLPVLGFSLALTIGTAVIFSLIHLLQASRNDVNDTLKEGGKGSASMPRRDRFRNVSVASQVALSLVLLIGAGLLIRSLDRVNRIDAGFNPERILKARMVLSDTRYPSEAQGADFVGRVIERVKRLPGVDSVGAIFGLPLEGMDPATSAYLLDQPAPAANEQSSAGYHQVSPGYFLTMGTALLKGRDFDRRDTTKGQQVVIVNQAFVRTFCNSEEVLGRRLNIGAGPGLPVQIVGVVSDVRHDSLTKEPKPELYVPLTQQFWGMATLVVKIKAEPATLAPALRTAVAELDPELPLDEVQPMTSLMSGTIALRRFQTTVLGLFAGAALALAALGIYGVTAYSVFRRRKEIGIRMALGARRNDILRLITIHGMKPALLGVAFGTALALLLARLIRGLLFKVDPMDATTYISVAVILSIVAGIACWIPARRASRADPMAALRTE